MKAAIMKISETRGGQTDAGKAVVQNLTTLVNEGRVESRDFGGGPTGGMTKGTYDPSSDTVYVHPAVLNGGETGLAATLGHEGTHKQQFAEQPNRKYTSLHQVFGKTGSDYMVQFDTFIYRCNHSA